MADFQNLRVVVFRVGDLVCGIPAGIVREILPRLPVTRIPGAADAVEGVVNVRGGLLTLIDGHVLTGRTADPADDGAIMVLERGERRCGLGVGQVLDFVEAAPDQIAGRDRLPGVDPRLVRAVGRVGGRQFVMLDVDGLLAPLLGA